MTVWDTHLPELYHWLTFLVVEGMKELVLPLLPEQPPVLEDKVHTWAIENWRDHPRRDHGPTFEAGGHPWYATFKIEEKTVGHLLLTSVGAFFSFPTATMSITSPSTSSMPIRKEPPQMILPAVYSLGWLYGIQKHQASTSIILPTTDSQRRRATGDLQDLSSYGSYTQPRGMILAATYWETITQRILLRM
jgi:hypothetical protein